MKRVSVHDLSPGMVLESVVRDQKGRFLIRAGETVQEQHIRICKIWGATDIWIKSDESEDKDHDTALEEIPEYVVRQAERRALRLFGQNDLTHPFLKELYRIVVQRKARQMYAQIQSGQKPARTRTKQPGKHSVYPTKRRTSITLQSLINDRMKLPTLPDIYYKTVEAVHNVDVPIADIAEIISKDPTLSAKVLQLVNSSFYGLLKRVETLTHALALIGTNQLMTIVTGVSVVSVFNNLSSSLVSMRQFWEHCVACGIVARQLASFMDGVVNSERYFVAGLLHDIGRLVMMHTIADEMSVIMAKARANQWSLVEAEQRVLGFDHAKVGAFLAQRWNLPVPLEKMLRYHHEPEEAKQSTDPAVISLANFLTIALGIGDSGDQELPAFDPETWTRLELSESILDNVVFQLDNQLNDTFVLIYGL